ncbi:hypothetical protein IV203_038328 [Nitzschia inconspicua]|uniref:Uncharacterized protein n=1 Tax=Nitzschia inconspicua TaxID=303405 RepID=A0A9K3PZP3_9STRA|nr:hypothetical protein IV203_038328 [Nitzschia inconspicua]
MRSIFVLSLLTTSSAFLFETFSPRPGLEKLVNDQTDQRVAVSLDIGQDDSRQAPRLAIKDMVLDLMNESPSDKHVKMPGFNGPHPNLSAGLRRLNLVEEGSFISQLGQQFVKALNGCWELVWREGAPAGNLICGLELPEEVQRNGAVLPKGRIYITFPVWTKETLEQMQMQKDKIMDLASQALAEKDAELAKMQETGNILQKALHYRNAYAAAEKYYIQPKKQFESVPSKDEVIPFQDDLLVTTKGTVWTKILPNGKQVLLGAANLKLAPMDA